MNVTTFLMSCAPSSATMMRAKICQGPPSFCHGVATRRSIFVLDPSHSMKPIGVSSTHTAESERKEPDAVHYLVQTGTNLIGRIEAPISFRRHNFSIHSRFMTSVDQEAVDEVSCVKSLLRCLPVVENAMSLNDAFTLQNADSPIFD